MASRSIASGALAAARVFYVHTPLEVVDHESEASKARYAFGNGGGRCDAGAGLRDDAGCSFEALNGTGGNGYFYCFAAN